MFQEAAINFINVVSNWFDICDDWFGTYVPYCRFGGVTVCTVTKVLATKLFFCKQSCIQYAVKFVNAVTVPITFNHPKIDIINPGLTLDSL